MRRLLILAALALLQGAGAVVSHCSGHVTEVAQAIVPQIGLVMLESANPGANAVDLAVSVDFIDGDLYLQEIVNFHCECTAVGGHETTNLRGISVLFEKDQNNVYTIVVNGLVVVVCIYHHLQILRRERISASWFKPAIQLSMMACAVACGTSPGVTLPGPSASAPNY